MNIEIVTTPNETLKESGFGTLNACYSVYNAVQNMGFNTRLTVIKTKEDLDDVIKRQPALVVLAVKYIPVQNGNEIWLSDFFSQNGINFTGSLREVLKYDSNKVHAKTHLINKVINTANYFIANPGQYKSEDELPIVFPLFLKPLDAANGNGIDDLSFVTNFTEFKNKTQTLYDSFNQPVLVEEYLDGKEFTVAIIKTPDQNLIVSAVEVIPQESTKGLRILGSQAKIDDSEILQKIDDNDIKNRVINLAVDAFNALGVRDFGRIDIKSNKSGKCFFMEANLVPGMTYGSSYFPKACEIELKLDYTEVIELLIAGGIARASSTVPPDVNPGSYGKLVADL